MNGEIPAQPGSAEPGPGEPSSEAVLVELRGLQAFGAHGVSEAERQVGRRIVLDIAFVVGGCASVSDDRLRGTVDYGAVAELAERVVRERSCRTLERLCALLADEIAARFQVEELKIRAAKTEPPIPQSIDEVAVTLQRR